MTVAAAILDVDGTLVDTNYQHALCWYRAFREHDIVLPVWRLHRHVGMGGEKYVAAVAGEEVEERLGDELRDRWEERHLGHFLDLLDARELLDGWTTKDDVEATKPEPDLVQVALEKAGTDDATMLGDTPWDVEAARKAGLETVGEVRERLDDVF